MLSQKSPIPSTSLPPHTPTSWPWHSPILRHIKFARPRGLSSQWWPTRPSSATNAARDTSSGGYWLVHNVVPPIGLHISLAPWVLSLAPPLGPCNPSNSWLWASTSVFVRPRQSHKRKPYLGPFSKILLVYAMVSAFGSWLWEGSQGMAVSRWSILSSQLQTLSL